MPLVLAPGRVGRARSRRFVDTLTPRKWVSEAMKRNFREILWGFGKDKSKKIGSKWVFKTCASRYLEIRPEGYPRPLKHVNEQT
jgi:hypothetical protein